MLRSLEEHKEYVELVEDERSQGHSRYHSVTCGINTSSPLLSLIGFDITKCLPYDIMHTVFEGVVKSHFQQVLKYLIDDKKYFTIDQFNLAIKTHKYGYSECTVKPSRIENSREGYHIKQSGIVYTVKKSEIVINKTTNTLTIFYIHVASQMMALIRLTPLIIGHFVKEDDEHWECFLLLWAICNMVCSFEFNPEDPRRLAWVIQLYLESFSHLYPCFTITPKMHYLVHLPEQMEMYVYFYSLFHYYHSNVYKFIGLVHFVSIGVCALSQKMPT